MSRPVVAIVGRPNVGKSTLFNTLAGERISIVKDTPGVTRDRIYADVTWLNYNFTLIDTGGIEPDSGDVILSQMREQAEIAIATADVIMFITDVRQGLQDADAKVADMLRRSKKPVVLVVNKVDSFEKFMPDVYEFYNLGIGEPYPVSASSMLGLGDMLDEVVKYFPEGSENQPEDERPKVAIIGKPNVGKSSLINKLAQEDRVIVSDIAGTTRGRTLQLKENDILVIEGIHGLNDKLSYTLPAESKFKIYISALTQLNIDEHNPLSTTDCRLLRRIVRDARTRGTTAQETIAMWKSVRRGEEKNIFPFQDSADVMFNSALLYEVAVLKVYAEPLLFQIPRDSAEYLEAKRLLKFLDYFLPLPTEGIAQSSLVREFVGGSCFNV